MEGAGPGHPAGPLPDRSRAAEDRIAKTRVDGPYYTWEGGIVLDPGEPVYRDFLLDQARRQVALFPESSGICIDRMDWLRMYNDLRDDGATWFEGRPARSLANSWRDLMARLAPLLHHAGQAVFVNNHTKRIDLLQSTDGFFDEFTYRGAPLNLTALLGVRKTVLGWTDSAGDMKADPDAFFQKYLYLGVYPMAPYPENDHSLSPRRPDRAGLSGLWPAAGRHAGQEMGPRAARLRGRRQRGQGQRLPSPWRLRGSDRVRRRIKASVRVVLRGLSAAGPNASAAAIHPGVEKPIPVRMSRRGGAWVLDVPLVRGCAMVKIGSSPLSLISCPSAEGPR